MNEEKGQLKQVMMFIDGACIDSSGAGGYGVVIKYGKHRKELSGGFRLTTNDRMEMMAAIAGLAALKEKCAVTIYSDSRSLVDGIAKGWAYECQKNGWRRENTTLLNLDLWKRLLELCDQHKVRFAWVKGRTEDPENERAHSLSKQAACGDGLARDKTYEEEKTRIEHSLRLSLSKAQAGRQKVSIILGGQSYVWAGDAWYEAETYLEPPQVIVRQLNKLLTRQLEQEDETITNVHVLLERAKKAREALQYHRAENLARRCLELAPGNQAALAVLCAALRAKGQPQKALDETNKYGDTMHLPLLTSQAAALCDLRRWDEAKMILGRALALGESEEAFSVMRRIKAARPDLYQG
jgi:ribonuclease HI